MRKIILYIATSLDGYIADRDGSVDWLTGDGSGEDSDSYAKLLERADTVLLGWNTYHQSVGFTMVWRAMCSPTVRCPLCRGSPSPPPIPAPWCGS